MAKKIEPSRESFRKTAPFWGLLIATYMAMASYSVFHQVTGFFVPVSDKVAHYFVFVTEIINVVLLFVSFRTAFAKRKAGVGASSDFVAPVLLFIVILSLGSIFLTLRVVF